MANVENKKPSNRNDGWWAIPAIGIMLAIALAIVIISDPKPISSKPKKVEATISSTLS